MKQGFELWDLGMEIVTWSCDRKLVSLVLPPGISWVFIGFFLFGGFRRFFFCWGVFIVFFLGGVFIVFFCWGVFIVFFFVWGFS